MPDITVSNSIDTFMQSADQAAMRTNLALGDAATKNTGTAAGTVAAGDDSRITGALQTSGGTMTGRIVAAADNTIAKISLGARTTGSSPTALVDGDIWISNQGALTYRDSSGPTSRPVASLSLKQTFNQPQTVAGTMNADPALTVSNTGTREVVTISNTATATSDAVVITNLGSGNSLVVNDETTPDSTRFAVANNGRVGIGVAPDAVVALAVDSTGIKFSDGTTQTTAASGGSGTVTSITAGTGLTGGTITTSGTVAADFGATTGKVTEGGTTVLKAGDTMTGKLNLTSSATTAPINLGGDTSVTTPANGDIFIQSVATGATASAAAARRLAYVGGDGSRYVIPTLSTVNTFTAAQGVTATSSGTILSATQTAGSGTAIAATQGSSATGSGLTVDLNNTSSTAAAVRITNQGTGPSLLVEDQASVDPSPFTVSNTGKVGVGVAPDAVAALSVDANGIKFSDGTVQITAGGAGGVSSFSAGTTGLSPSTSTTGAVTLGGTLGITNGGTGATTANSALNALLPSQASHNGKVLTTDGANTSWTTVGGGSGTVTSVGVSGGTTGLTTSGGPVTSSGTITLAGTLALANGGTGATTQSGAANAVLPSQATNSGKFLTTDGSNVSWATAGGGSATPTNRQVFLSTGTWTKPTGAKTVLIRTVSNGFGGGAGTRSLPGKTAFGGSGGASGVFSEIQYDAATLPSSLTITIPTAPVGGYASFFCNNISTVPPVTTTTQTTVKSGNRTYATTFKFLSGGGAAAFLASLSTGGTGVGATSNDGGGSNSAVTTTLGLSASGGCGGQNSNITGSAPQGRYLFDTMFTAPVSAATTDFTTPTNNSCPSWSGAFNGNSTSGGGGGITAADRATGGSGSNGGGWIAPVTLTNVATTSGSSSVTCASTTGLKVGMSIPDLVTSTGSTNSVQVASITSATTFNMNVTAASTASGLTVVAAVGAAGGGGGGASIQSSTPILVTGVNLISGSTTVDCTSTRGILPGMTIFSNANIPAGTTVASLVSETQFTISAAATGSETGGKLVIAGAGTISGLSVTSGSGTVTATSTLGLKWGQAICTTASTVGTHLNPSTSATRLNHVAAVTSGTNFVVSGTAGSTGSGLSATVINTVGFLSGVSCTAGSPIVTVSDTTPLYPGMLVQIGTQGTWTTTVGSGATLAAAFDTGGANKFLGDGVVESPNSAASTGTAVSFGSISDVVASVTNGTYFSTRMALSNNALPEGTTLIAIQSGYSIARILSVDSATQITLDVNATGTYSGATLMYAFTGGHGGRGSSGAVEIITYF